MTWFKNTVTETWKIKKIKVNYEKNVKAEDNLRDFHKVENLRIIMQKKKLDW